VATVLLLVAAAAGCGGGGTKKRASAPAVTTTASVASQSVSSATTTRSSRVRLTHTAASSSVTLEVSSPYKCNGRPLRAIEASGPVAVKPAIVKPGQSFTVTVTDPSAKVADVTLAGVASTPILAHGRLAGDHVAATLTMPRYASCGNKLLEVEGDVSAEAYVGVSG
jgi:hypothetical protein